MCWARSRRPCSLASVCGLKYAGESAVLGIVALVHHGDVLGQPADNLVGRNALGVGVEVQLDAMPQDRPRNRADIFLTDIHASVEHGASLGPQDDVLTR